MSWDNNIYNNPEKFGLKIFGIIHDPGANYSYDTFVVFERTADGKLFYTYDSGCSCPIPFDNQGSNDLDMIGTDKKTINKFIKDIKNHCSYREGADKAELDADKTQLIQKVTAHLKKLKAKEEATVATAEWMEAEKNKKDIELAMKFKTQELQKQLQQVQMEHAAKAMKKNIDKEMVIKLKSLKNEPTEG